MGKSNKKLLGVAMIVVALMVVVVGVVLLPLSEAPVQNDPTKNNLITCTVTVQNDFDTTFGDFFGGAKIRSFQCQAISQCGLKDGFGTTPSTGTQVLLGGISKSVTFNNNYEGHTDQISLCVPSTSTQGVIKLFKDSQEKDSKTFTIGG